MGFIIPHRTLVCTYSDVCPPHAACGASHAVVALAVRVGVPCERPLSLFCGRGVPPAAGADGRRGPAGGSSAKGHGEGDQQGRRRNLANQGGGTSAGHGRRRHDLICAG